MGIDQIYQMKTASALYLSQFRYDPWRKCDYISFIILTPIMVCSDKLQRFLYVCGLSLPPIVLRRIWDRQRMFEEHWSFRLRNHLGLNPESFKNRENSYKGHLARIVADYNTITYRSTRRINSRLSDLCNSDLCSSILMHRFFWQRNFFIFVNPT